MTGRPARYEFVIDGLLSARAQATFPELTAHIDVAHGKTTMTGSIHDADDLRMTLARFDDLNLTVLEMRQLPSL